MVAAPLSASSALPGIGSSAAARLGPYRVSLAADAQRSSEEARVRVRMADRRAREEARKKEAVRRQIVNLARAEAAAMDKPLEVREEIESQKRYLAHLSTLRSDERYFLARSQLQMRWFEATPMEKEYRDRAFEERRNACLLYTSPSPRDS